MLNMQHMHFNSVRRLIKTLWLHFKQERRLPGRIGNNKYVVYPGFIWFKLKCFFHAHCVPRDVSCVVMFPITRNRYALYLLIVLQQCNDKMIVVWDPSLREFVDLFAEGRRISSLKGVYFINNRAFKKWSSRCSVFGATEWLARRSSFIGIDYVKAPDCNVEMPLAARTFIINTDLARKPLPSSYLFPYGPHPNNLIMQPTVSANAVADLHIRRAIRVFFSGQLLTASDHDHLLIEREFGVPCRKTILSALKRRYPSAVWIDTYDKRLEFERYNFRTDIALCVATFKGDPRNWFADLSRADFFLCPPGSHMLMCHNSIEAMSVGCIPIICYENWFSPNLIDRVNCLVYRDTEGLYAAVEAAIAMPKEEVVILRAGVLSYYKRHLFVKDAAERVFGRWHNYLDMTVYINQEDCENYAAAGADAVLYNGGTLQGELDEHHQNSEIAGRFDSAQAVSAIGNLNQVVEPPHGEARALRADGGSGECCSS